MTSRDSARCGGGTTNDLLTRIEGEYREMPGLRLTLAQASRLWQLEQSTCRALLEQLVREHILFATKDGAYLAFPMPSRLRASARRQVPLAQSA